MNGSPINSPIGNFVNSILSQATASGVKFVTDLFNLLQNSPTYTGGALTVTDHLGNLVTSPANIAGFQGGRLTDGVWYDTALDGTPLQPSALVPTKAGSKKWYQEPFASPFGYSNWPARTNKCTCRKFNPVDITNVVKEGGDANTTMSIVTELSSLLSMAKDLSGATVNLTGLCSTLKVYELNNLTGGVLASAVIQGEAGNVNPHTASTYVALVAGPNATLRLNSTGTAINTSAYTRTTNIVTPITTSRPIRIDAPAGTIVRFILPQLEEGVFATPPIFDPLNDSLTSITRAATNLSMLTAGVLPVNDFGIWGEVIPGASGQANVFTLSTVVNPDFSEYLGVYLYSATATFLKRRAATSYNVELTYTHTKDTPFQYQAFQSRVYGMGIRVKQQGGNWSAWALKNDADGRLDAPIASTYQVGARNNTSHFAGYYPGLAIIAHADPKAELERLATLYGA